MKRILAASMTVVILAILVWYGSRPEQKEAASTPERVPSPGDRIDKMFQAAEQGELSAYLNCFAGQERARLDRELANLDEADFVAALKAAFNELKGRAVFGAVLEDHANATVTVERIYATRTDRQTYVLRRDEDTWRIYDVKTAESYQPAKSYGTPVGQ